MNRRGAEALRILGIDPGYAIIGWGILDYEKNRFSVVDYGAITTPAGMPFSQRLECIDEEICYILKKYKPEALSMEKLYFTNNKTTGIDVAQARGVLLLECSKAGLEIHEYTPIQVKQGAVGYGKAEKKQVMEMTRIILGLPEIPKPDDTADALALAICHAHVGGSALGALESNARRPLKVRKGI